MKKNGNGLRHWHWRAHSIPDNWLQLSEDGRHSFRKQSEGGADVWRSFKGIFHGGRREDGDTPNAELGEIRRRKPLPTMPSADLRRNIRGGG